jgi:hypothetical protein
MPRKLRNPKARRDDVKPAIVYWLMTGDHNHPHVNGQHRLPGWFEAFQVCHFERIERSGHATDHLRGTFAREVQPHIEAMVDLAKECGFVPWCKSGKTPKGPAFEKWCETFLTEHVY